MGKKLPPRKLSALSSRRPSIGLSSPDDRTSDMPIHSPIQEEFEPQGYAQGEVPPSYFPNSDFPQALHLWCEEGQLQHPTTKLPHLPLEEDPNPQEESFESPPEPSPGFGRSWAYKNILGVSLSFLFVFTSFQGLQNLQSSINSSGGLGLANLAILYVFFTLFGFFSPGVLEILGTKYSMLVGLTSFLLYTFANFYPSWYLFVPASVLTGMGSALLWSASSSHIVEVAVIIAPKLSKDKDHLISLFTGIFFCFFQLSQIPGNLASSLILFPYGGLNASNISGCTHSTASQEDFDQKYLYVLFSVYSVSVFVGILCCAVMVSPLHKNVPFFSSKRKFEVFFKAPLVDLLKIMKECKMLLLTPAAIFTGLQQAFAFGTFTEVRGFYIEVLTCQFHHPLFSLAGLCRQVFWDPPGGVYYCGAWGDQCHHECGVWQDNKVHPYRVHILLWRYHQYSIPSISVAMEPRSQLPGDFPVCCVLGNR